LVSKEKDDRPDILKKRGKHMNHPPTDVPVILLYNLDRSWPPSDVNEILDLVQNLVEGLSTIGHPTQAICLEDDRLDQVMTGCDPTRQIVFNWCEEVPGIPRSSALVARMLEDLGFTFTGADSQALLFSQDKPAVKDRLLKKQVPTPYWKLYSGDGTLDWNCFPAIVKPAYEHYSCGITQEAVVHNHPELSQQAAYVMETFHQPVLVEDFIEGREFHVSVVGNGRLKVFPIAEMDFSAIQDDCARLCTYDSKFEPASADYQMIQLHLPASLTVEESQELEAVAIAAFRATVAGIMPAWIFVKGTALFMYWMLTQMQTSARIQAWHFQPAWPAIHLGSLAACWSTWLLTGTRLSPQGKTSGSSPFLSWYRWFIRRNRNVLHRR
jgi:D-alanine-D-alanine ligase